jgi:hypothetical protein
MRRLLAFLFGLFLVTSLVAGSAVRAVEIGAGGEITPATEWLHSPGDHDHVPADNHRNSPHHHGHCAGHDLATPLKACRIASPMHKPNRLRPADMHLMAAAPPATMLRPPIA